MTRRYYPGPLKEGTAAYRRWLRAALWFLAQWEEAKAPGYGRTPKAQRPRCGAKCRDGHPCQALPVWDREKDRPRNGRCRLHGGLSTGPRTEEGKRRAREGARRGARMSARARRESLKARAHSKP